MFNNWKRTTSTTLTSKDLEVMSIFDSQDETKILAYLTRTPVNNFPSWVFSKIATSRNAAYQVALLSNGYDRSTALVLKSFITQLFNNGVNDIQVLTAMASSVSLLEERFSFDVANRIYNKKDVSLQDKQKGLELLVRRTRFSNLINHIYEWDIFKTSATLMQLIASSGVVSPAILKELLIHNHPTVRIAAMSNYMLPIEDLYLYVANYPENVVTLPVNRLLGDKNADYGVRLLQHWGYNVDPELVSDELVNHYVFTYINESYDKRKLIG